MSAPTNDDTDAGFTPAQAQQISRRRSLEDDFAAPTRPAVPARPAALPMPATVEPEDDEPGDDPTVPSNVHLPIDVAEQIQALREDRKLTVGELIILAIETTHPDLDRYVHPGGQIGGGLFKARGVGAAARAKVDTTQVAYSLLRSDLDVIDHLKTQLAARSRSHLITAAFQAFLTTTEIEKD